MARVSSKNQANENITGLLRYCMKHGHWSVFEMADLKMEIVCPLAIAIQAIRHRSFSFQQFSGRYQDQTFMGELTEGITEEALYEKMFYIPTVFHRQDTRNRQNSIAEPDQDDFSRAAYLAEFKRAYEASLSAYKRLIDLGMAKEDARFVLPEGVMTKFYMKGSIRSWVTYLRVRDEEGVVQYQHVELARLIKECFSEAFPIVAGAAGF